MKNNCELIYFLNKHYYFLFLKNDMIKKDMIQLKTLFLNVADNCGAQELMCI